MNALKKELTKMTSVTLCIFMTLFFFPLQIHAKETVKVGWVEGATYYKTGEKGERSGYGYEYLRSIAGYTGWDYNYVYSDFSASLTSIQNGNIDIMGGVSYTDERAETMLFSDSPMAQEKYYLYADLSEKPISVSNLSSLEGMRIGVMEHGVPSEQFTLWEDRHGLHTQHVAITSSEDALNKLANDEIDGFISVESTAWEKDKLSPVACIGSSDVYFVINKQRMDLKEALDNAMRRIEYDDPHYTNTLYSKYLSARSLEMLSEAEKAWINAHGTLKVGYVNKDSGVSTIDEKTGKLTGIINTYMDYAKDCLGNQKLSFETVGFNTQKEQLQALQSGQIDMIFHINQNPYEAEENGILLSASYMTETVAVLTNQKYFDEMEGKILGVSKDNILGKWYISYNYPNWKIQEFDTTRDAVHAIYSNAIDGIVVKAGQSSIDLKNSKIRSVFLSKTNDSCFAVNGDNTVLLSILNKTIKTMSGYELSGALSMYDNMSRKVTLVDFIKDNLLLFSCILTGILTIIFVVIVWSLKRTKKALKEAESANEAKSNFLFNMSHDIRTPMNAILGYNHLMKKELTEPKQMEYQAKIEQSGHMLLSILNNVLDMARIESGQSKLDENYVDVREMEKEITTVFIEESKQKNIDMEWHVHVEHHHILCDAIKLKEILINLLSNAVKYTPEGGKITVDIQELPCDKQGYMKVRAIIKDTGIGMSKDFMPMLYDSFARERNTTIGKISGTGLGMSIVKRYVDLMGGTISCQSETGKGTTFTILLEHKIADKAYYEKEDNQTSFSRVKDILKGKHILMAEDNNLNAEIASTILEDAGLIIDRVEDGIQCVEQLEKMPVHTYDLILMDIQMPHMDGYKATEIIRSMEDKGKASIPIVAMTANAFEEDKEMAMKAGMNGHVSKPIDAQTILKAIMKAIEE